MVQVMGVGLDLLNGVSGQLCLASFKHDVTMRLQRQVQVIVVGLGFFTREEIVVWCNGNALLPSRDSCALFS